MIFKLSVNFLAGMDQNMSEDISQRSRVIGWTLSFKMAAWWPYWISDQAEIQSTPTFAIG